MFVIKVIGRFTMTFDDVDTALRYGIVWQKRYGYGNVEMEAVSPTG